MCLTGAAHYPCSLPSPSSFLSSWWRPSPQRVSGSAAPRCRGQAGSNAATHPGSGWCDPH